jgi:hypothetical protein
VLKNLAATIAPKSDDVLVRFTYADGVLSVECDDEKFVASATGLEWPLPIAVRAGGLRELPKRLMSEEICILVDDTHLGIGTRRYGRVANEAVYGSGEAAPHPDEDA